MVGDLAMKARDRAMVGCVAWHDFGHVFVLVCEHAVCIGVPAVLRLSLPVVFDAREAHFLRFPTFANRRPLSACTNSCA